MAQIAADKQAMNKPSGKQEADKELIEKLIRMVKREVKQIMEEAVTRKYVHEDSSSITALCAAVDQCLSHGLKRRALGLFKTNSTTALLQKVAKKCEPASLVLKKVTIMENADPNKRSSSSSDSLTAKTRLSFKIKSSQSQTQAQSPLTTSGNMISTSGTNANNSGTITGTGSGVGGGGAPRIIRYLWIRVALFDKHLANIVDHVVQNSANYYEKDALVSDPVTGQIFASLLVGPCALDYSKMKTGDQFWTDPPADELVQRHRISSTFATSSASTSSSSPLSQATPPTARKPLGLSYRCRPSALNNYAIIDDETIAANSAAAAATANATNGSPISRPGAICWSPRDYVESLHQNSRSTLLYGKNNVIMQPKDDLEPLPGYLSLHQESYELVIKWTPNQLINGRTSQNSAESGESICEHYSFDKSQSNEAFWNHALNVSVENIVYLHCHQQKHSCGSIVMVGRDGVMHPPIKFPKGGHLLAFLSCLETGLMPYGQLDPPLWSQKGKGKVFPKLRRKGQSPQCSESESDCADDCNGGSDADVASDYVFRIISICDKPDTISPELIEPNASKTGGANFADRVSPSIAAKSGADFAAKSNENGSTSLVDNLERSIEMRRSSRGTVTINNGNAADCPHNHHDYTAENEKQHIELLCDTMRKQIISRAFYGWLAYCRHLKTVRTHLADLVNPTIVRADEPNDATAGITAQLWSSARNDRGQITLDAAEFYRLIYYGGIEHSIRSQVWPYLLEHYRFDDTLEDRKRQDIEMRQKYEMIMSDWLAVEAIVRQRDKEIVVANLAKLSSGSNNSTSDMAFSIEKSMLQATNNDVFEIDDISITDESRKSSMQDGAQSEIEIDRKMDSNAANTTVLPAENGEIERPHLAGIGKCEKSALTRKQLKRYPPVESVASLSCGPIGKINNLQNIFITNPSVDQQVIGHGSIDCESKNPQAEDDTARLPVNPTESGGGGGGGAGSQCVSPASSNGGVYTNELLDLFSLNLHRIDKDVQRCDRNFWYFTKENLEKLRNVMCTYVWEHLEIGYVQGMCDLVAPLLVIFDDEVCTYSCFCELMKRMASNFPHGGAMDTHFANMRSLIQVFDGDIFELMHQNGDYTHFYFCYRWFLLDFKRELVYADVFSAWETIWAAKHVASSSFVLFIALALVEYYREIILENNMDFTDIIKFFNEMAERHDAQAVLRLARGLVLQIQLMIDNK